MGEILGKGKIVTNGLVLSLDAADRNSYPGSGTTWRDMSGRGNNGTLTNGPTFDNNNGGSISYDGSNDYVNTSVQRNATMTLEAFCFTPATNFIRAIFESDGTGTNKVELGYTWYNPRTFNLFFGPDSYTDNVEVPANFDNNWHHFLFSANNGTGSLYLDGVLRFGPTNFGATARTDTIRIGGTNRTFQGRIAIARIYDRALSQTEILQNYNALKSRFGL
jgi:hypothetical protein